MKNNKNKQKPTAKEFDDYRKDTKMGTLAKAYNVELDVQPDMMAKGSKILKNLCH